MTTEVEPLDRLKPRPPIDHELRSWPDNFAQIAAGYPVELRRNDRDFRRGDRITYREWCPSCGPNDAGAYTGDSMRALLVEVCVGLVVTPPPPETEPLGALAAMMPPQGYVLLGVYVLSPSEPWPELGDGDGGPPRPLCPSCSKPTDAHPVGEIVARTLDRYLETRPSAHVHGPGRRSSSGDT